jgi:hypothetical protein
MIAWYLYMTGDLSDSVHDSGGEGLLPYNSLCQPFGRGYRWVCAGPLGCGLRLPLLQFLS